MSTRTIGIAAGVALLAGALAYGAAPQAKPAPVPAAAPAAALAAKPSATAAAPASAAHLASQIERGRYLVLVASCNDCHTPKKFGPQGPEADTTRLLSGHPASESLPAAPAGLTPTGWIAVTNAGLTAWAGPWGVSYTTNLTPDVATGLGSWTEDLFIKTLRSGKHLGVGRDILPPMPWQFFGQMKDEDLKAVWAYLRSIPAIRNAVPEPVPPPSAPAGTKR